MLVQQQSSNSPFRTISNRTLSTILSLICIITLHGCGSHDKDAKTQTSTKVPLTPHTLHLRASTSEQSLSPMAALGEKLFFDPTLSASGKMSCASCHNPEHAFSPTNALSVQMGGKDLNLQGLRAVPNLTYSRDIPFFSIGGAEDEATDSQEAILSLSQNISEANNKNGNLIDRQSNIMHKPKPIQYGKIATMTSKLAGNQPNPADLVPEGGLFWDGRANNLQEQALGPLMNPLEMANTSKSALVAKLKKLPYIDELKKLAGTSIMNNDSQFLSEVLFMIGRYQTEDLTFAPYSSRYDQYLKGKIKLSEAEMRGLKLFNTPDKGNCAACHIDKPSSNGHAPLFTDFEYEALGVPRNMNIKANLNPNFYDLGICGPSRNDIYAHQTANCGLFKTPSLRNVAVRQAYFHNGVYHNLKDVLRFYVNRDTRPELVYPKMANGQVNKFNDLPQKYKGNIDYIDAPFTRKLGGSPALTEAEMDDVVAFLQTLTDAGQVKKGN